LAACAERDTTSPRAISSGGASFAGRGGSTCSFSTVSSTASAYFTSNQDPVVDMIKVMKDAYNTNNGGNVAATPEGWVILSRVADKRLTDSVTTGQAGAAFVVAVANCMADLAANTSPLALPAALTDNSNANLARVLNSGIFDVRTGGATGAPAAGKNKQGGVRSLGSPIWGVETQTATSTWPGTIKYAVVGYPIKDSNPLLTNTQQIDQSDDLAATYQALDPSPWPFNAFELLTVPTTAVTDHSTLRVGICVDNNATANDGSVWYLVHNDAELLPNSSPAALCALTVANGLTGPWYTRLAKSAARFFKPGVLFAQDEKDFIGGLPSGWSPQGAGQLDANQVTLTVTTQPKNNVKDSTDNSLVVTATLTNSTTPVPGVRIDSLVVLNNQGSPAGAVIVDGSTNLTNPTLFTEANGTATVHFAIGKPGAYYVVVWGSLDGHAISPGAKSGKFTVKN
jgi:hypothetical protein